MSSPVAYDAFHDLLVAEWTDTPIKFENEFFQDLLDAETPAPFVYVEIFGSDYNQASMGAPGANLWLEEGSTYLHVMIPSGDGSRTARVYANALLNLFREIPLAAGPNGTIKMPDMSIGEGQPGKDFPNYWAMTVCIHWHRYDITGT